MGCYFEIYIQALFGGCWVSIVNFGTKTSCGGFPLCAAARSYCKIANLKGEYGLEYPVLKKNELAEYRICY